MKKTNKQTFFLVLPKNDTYAKRVGKKSQFNYHYIANYVLYMFSLF